MAEPDLAEVQWVERGLPYAVVGPPEAGELGVRVQPPEERVQPPEEQVLTREPLAQWF